MDFYSDPNAGTKVDWSKQDVKELRRKLITANHILHYHGVVDAFGHISIRHPQKPDVYIMCGYMAPGVVSTQDDLIEYYIKDSSTVDPNAKKGYSERFIHGELFRVYPSINCIVHSHAEEVLPYVTAGVPLKPIFHMAGFLGTDVPVFDIAGLYEAGDQQDMLVRNARIGTALAQTFSTTLSTESSKAPDHTVVLMRRHGFTTHGTDIETAVYRSIYTKTNAKALTEAITLRTAFGSLKGMGEAKFDLEPLTEEMCRGCLKMNEGTQDKPWVLWCKEVEATGLYINKG